MVTALFLTNDGSVNGWAVVGLVCLAAPFVVGFALRYRDRRR
jgi:hypothetical protein